MVKNYLNSESQKKTKGHKDPELLRGLREIGAFLGVSPMSILRWHREFEDPSLSFPLFPRFTGIGAGFEYLSHTGLILLWMERLSRKNAVEQKSNLRHPRKRKVVRMGETGVGNRVG